MLNEILFRGLMLILAAALFAIPLLMANDQTIATRWVFFAVFALCPFVSCLVALAFERR